MADAFPMLATSAECQWRGLPAEDRLALTVLWARPKCEGLVSYLSGCSVPHRETPIWTVSGYIGQSMALISVKEDWLVDVP